MVEMDDEDDHIHLPVNCVPHAAAPFMMDYPEPLPQGTLLRMTVE